MDYGQIVAHLDKADRMISHVQRLTPKSHDTRPALLAIRTSIRNLIAEHERAAASTP